MLCLEEIGEFLIRDPGAYFPVFREMMFCAVMLMTVCLYKPTVFQIIEVDVEESDGYFVLFSMSKRVTRFGFNNPIFKCLDDPDFKIMQAAMGRLQMCLFFCCMDPGKIRLDIQIEQFEELQRVLVKV